MGREGRLHRVGRKEYTVLPPYHTPRAPCYCFPIETGGEENAEEDVEDGETHEHVPERVILKFSVKMSGLSV
jgi:hypothetical protein